MTNEERNKIEKSIKDAKKILKENPSDTWVAKGLEVMEEYLKQEVSKIKS